MNKKLIFGIVDDDDIYRYTIQRTIRDLDLSEKNLIFTNGEQALQFLLDHTDSAGELPDVLLLDVNMPIMDGFEFMKEYENIASNLVKKIVIFMISSSVNPVDIDRAKNFPGITDYIVKPIEPGKLQRIISELDWHGLV